MHVLRLKSFIAFIILLVAAACRIHTPVSPALITSPVSTPTRSHPPTATASPGSVPRSTSTLTAVAPHLLPTTTATAHISPILSASTISGLEQLDLVEFAPWDLVLATSWSPDGKLLAVAAGESIYLYSSALREQTRLDVGNWTTSLAFSPGGEWLASGDRDGQIRIWDMKNEKLILRLAAHKKGVNAVAFSPDGLILASGGNDAVARLWDITMGEKIAQLIGGTYAVPSIAFSLDGADLAITNGMVIRIRDVKTGRFVQTLHSEDSNYSIALSSDGKYLASGSTTGRVYLWDLAVGDPPQILSSPEESVPGQVYLVWSVAFSPDSGLLAATDSRGTLRFWDAADGKFLASRSSVPQAVTCLAFSPDGRYLVTGSLDGTLRLWAVR